MEGGTTMTGMSTNDLPFGTRQEVYIPPNTLASLIPESD